MKLNDNDSVDNLTLILRELVNSPKFGKYVFILHCTLSHPFSVDNQETEVYMYESESLSVAGVINFLWQV